MKKLNLLTLIAIVILLAATLAACGSAPADAEAEEAPAVILTDEAKTCIDCHTDETVGIVMDWDGSRHEEEGVSCINCHEVEADSPMALSGVEGHEDLTVTVSMLVAPATCGECHEDAVEQFHASGHERAAVQYEAKDAMQTLINVHEGRNNPELSGAPDETGCQQCHGVTFVVDETGHPSPETYPSAGIGNVYPTGEIGNCTVCHSRHSFEISEARKIEACGGCHIGPDHPDIEIYENTKHGQIYATEGEEWVWDSPSGEWEPGDYRAPTCATCHMSGIGDLEPTHNVSQRLYWNLWAKKSGVRNSDDPHDMMTGDGEAGRAEMEQVCGECHTTTHTKNYFASGDKAVRLYNEEYWAPVEAMRVELAEAGLLKENPWEDGFMTLHYHIWHHEGRRARQGAMMGAPDWAHWHGFFMLQQKLNLATEIYEMRMETGEIETAAPWSLSP
ncbi:MAG: beta-ketoacyl-ACP synthase [Anaerolineae bacterium]|jgi:hydroxylamine dehydrogenase|nr:beta-ketoacyl-ACP synthase [Anaerolineae bacterium]MBT7991516.1 beta-ketoacyl-ACP synthase [Anaerolineae bacterium]